MALAAIDPSKPRKAAVSCLVAKPVATAIIGTAWAAATAAADGRLPEPFDWLGSWPLGGVLAGAAALRCGLAVREHGWRPEVAAAVGLAQLLPYARPGGWPRRLVELDPGQGLLSPRALASSALSPLVNPCLEQLLLNASGLFVEGSALARREGGGGALRTAGRILSIQQGIYTGAQWLAGRLGGASLFPAVSGSGALVVGLCAYNGITRAAAHVQGAAAGLGAGQQQEAQAAAIQGAVMELECWKTVGVSLLLGVPFAFCLSGVVAGEVAHRLAHPAEPWPLLRYARHALAALATSAIVAFLRRD